MGRVVQLRYGRGLLPLQVPEDAIVLLPRDEEGLADPADAVRRALREPVGRPPLRELARGRARAAIVIPDHTRPCPTHLLVPLLVEEMGLPASQVQILVGTGTHRASTPGELARMLGEEVAASHPVKSHDARDRDSLVYLGRTPRGGEVWIMREYHESDLRVVVGFIEPHFMAGFSGGPKGVIPALAGMDTVLHLHSAALLDDPRSTWGVLESNPVQEEIRAAVSLDPPEFLVNVTLNRSREITGVYAGHVIDAHRVGAQRVLAAAKQEVEAPFDVVVTTNSGYPLDQNLYQTVKGMSAAARIVRPGGAILAVSECSDGIPDHGPFRDLIHRYGSAGALLDGIRAPGHRVPDQWEAHILGLVAQHADVYLYSSLPAESVPRGLVRPVADYQGQLEKLLSRYGPRLAVLPEGPLTLPTLAQPAGVA